MVAPQFGRPQALRCRIHLAGVRLADDRRQVERCRGGLRFVERLNIDLEVLREPLAQERAAAGDARCQHALAQVRRVDFHHSGRHSSPIIGQKCPPEWGKSKKRPELFRKRVYNQPGLDTLRRLGDHWRVIT